jgi:Mg2+-importing ATPase
MTAVARPASTPPIPPSAPGAGHPGLTTEEARRSRDALGANEIRRSIRIGPLRQIAASLASPLMLILLTASAVAGWMGQHVDATIIVVTVGLSVLLDAVQTARSTSAADRLRQTIVLTATVFRDGHWLELPRADLVLGDVIHLSAGDLVPADARLFESRDLRVEQATLTGESVPAEKAALANGTTGTARGTDAAPADPHRPDLVFLGTSVVAGFALAEITATGSRTAFGDIAARLGDVPPETDFARGLRDLSRLLSQTVVFLVLFLMLVSIVFHRDPLQSLLFAVALAVGVVPEFMPMITTLTLSSGAVRLARQRMIVKHLAAIQNFGGIDVLCSDKTGTLTRGSLSLLASIDSAGNDDPSAGALGALNARFGTGVRSPLDDALLTVAPATDVAWVKVDEVPFDFDRRRASVVVDGGGERLLVTKGAPESVTSSCDTFTQGDRVATFDEPARRAATGIVQSLSERGIRVLAVATRRLPTRARSDRDDEVGLTLRGFVTFEDQPLPDAAAAIAALAADGVTVKIITGDDAAVARHVCDRTGLPNPRIVLGDELDAVSDLALGPLVERTDLFARVSPRQKLRIVLALKAAGHVVGYLGDGINDAPSLHAADVGISVATAVDVAREAADIVMLDRGLAVLHAGILEGRRAYGNIMKYLLMSTSSSFGNMFSMAVASVVIPFLPMLPTQILLNNFLYDLAQVTIPTDRVDEEYLRKPHHWDMGILRSFMIRVGLVSSLFDFLTFGLLLHFFPHSEILFHSGWFIESLATQVCVLFVIRTARNPLQSRPSGALALTVVGALAIGLALPFTPLAAVLGLTPPPGIFFAYVAGATVAYLGLVELVKRRTLSRAFA